MKNVLITDYGLKIDGRDVKPGSRIQFTTDVPVHWSRFAKDASDGRTFEVATPAPKGDPVADEELEAARNEYAELYGSRPNGKMLLATIREKIDAKLSE